MKYCKNCKQNVRATKKFSWFWFLAGLVCFGVGAMVYLVYYWLKPANKCPMCGSKVR